MRTKWLLVLIVAVLLGACQTQPVSVTSTGAPPEADIVSTPTSIPTDIPPPPRPTIGFTPRPTIVPVGRFATDPATMAYVRLVHAASDIDNIDVYIEDLAITSNMARYSSTGRTNVQAGEYTVTVTQYGAPRDIPLAARTFSVVPGESRILLFAGSGDALNITEYTERTGALNAQEARVNFINAVARLPDHSVTFNDVPLTDPIAFDRESGERVVPPTDATIAFTEANSEPVTLRTSLAPRTSSTFILVGDAQTRSSLQILEFRVDVPGSAEIRVVNAMQDAGSVSVTLDSQLIAIDLAQYASTDFQPIDSGSRIVSVFGTNRPVGVTIQPDTKLTVVVAGNAARPQPLIITEDMRPVRTGFSRMIFVNTLPGAQTVEIAFDGSPLDGVPPLSYGAVSQPETLDPGTYTVTGRDPFGEALLELSDSFVIEPERAYLYLFTGQMDSTPLVLSDTLTVDSALDAIPIDATPDPLANAVSEIRFVHLMAGVGAASVQINGATVAELNYAEQSPLVNVTGGVLIFDVLTAGAEAPLWAENRPLIPGPYSVFLTGTPPFVRAVVIDDSGLYRSGQAPLIRMINLTDSPTHVLSLASAPPTDPLSTPSINLTPVSNPFERATAPLGISRLTAGIRGGTTSSQATLAAGAYDLLVLDGDDRVGLRLRSVTLEDAALYDVVALELFDQARIEAVVLPYPEP